MELLSFLRGSVEFLAKFLTNSLYNYGP